MSSPQAESRSPWLTPVALRVVVPLGMLTLAFCGYIWPQWVHNPDLSHGFFTPFVFILLLAESRDGGIPRWLASGPRLRFMILALSALSVLTFAFAGVLAASTGWSHSAVSFLLAGALVGALLAGLFCLADERVGLVPLNWTSVTAVGLWLLAAPLPTGTYARLTLGLQGFVSTSVLHGLHFLGIPARQFGNLIQLTTTTVGIEEACSGIRSLLSCLYAGLFFAAWQVRHTTARVLLIVMAPLLAIAMNFIRSFALTLMANARINIGGFWHDATGYAVLALTAVILALASFWLGSEERFVVRTTGTLRPRKPAAGSYATVVMGGAAAVVALGIFFASYATKAAPVAGAKAVDVATLLPTAEEAAGWQIYNTPDLAQFSGILQTTQLTQRTYLRDIDGQQVQVTIYIAHWDPGQAPVSLVASHTPDACWPGAGWEQKPDARPQMSLSVDGHALPVAEHRVFLRGGQEPYQVWFWHVYQGRVINYENPYSVPALFKLALKYGFRREGDQYFVRLSTNASWELLAREPLVQKLCANLGRVGLSP